MDNLFPNNFHIGVDGLDGVGKTTFIEALSDKIELESEKLGYSPNIGKFSNIKQTEFDNLYRMAAVLMEEKQGATVMKALLEHVVQRNISMSTRSNSPLTISDRTILSTLLYQNMSGDKYFATLMEESLLPDVFILLQLKDFQTWSNRVSKSDYNFVLEDVYSRYKDPYTGDEEKHTDRYSYLNRRFLDVAQATATKYGKKLLVLDAAEPLQLNLNKVWMYVFALSEEQRQDEKRRKPW